MPTTPLNRSIAAGLARFAFGDSVPWDSIRSSRSLFGALLINQAGTAAIPYLALYLTIDGGRTIGQAGVVVMIAGIGGVIGQFAAGWVSDHFEPEPLLIGSLAATSLSLYTLPSFASHPGWLEIAVLILGIVSNAYRPLAAKAISNVVDDQSLDAVYNFQYWLMNVGYGVAMAFGGLVLEFGFTLLFYLDGTSSLLAAALLTATRWRNSRNTNSAAQRRRLRRDQGTKKGVTVNDSATSAPVRRLSQTAIIAFCFAFFGYLLAFNQTGATLSLKIVEDGNAPSWYGIAMALNALLIVVVQPFVLKSSHIMANRWVLLAGMCVVGVGVALIAPCHRPLDYLATTVVWTAGEIMVGGLGQALVSRESPPEVRGRFLGIYGTVWGTAECLAPVVGTWVMAHSASGLWPAAGGLALISAAVAWVATKGRENRERTV